MSDFETSVARLLNLVGHWQQARWAQPSRSAGRTRGDVVHALAQHLANLAADAEARVRRAVPRLPDMVLPDQIRVLADDLLAAAAVGDPLSATAGGPVGATDPAEVLAAAATAVDAARVLV